MGRREWRGEGGGGGMTPAEGIPAGERWSLGALGWRGGHRPFPLTSTEWKTNVARFESLGLRGCSHLHPCVEWVKKFIHETGERWKKFATTSVMAI